MLATTFMPTAVEQKHSSAWESNGAFKADENSARPPYAIMMPPPNVTGALHMGHALTFTLQDILIRHQRMKGRDALWQPGTDHAGIATQMMVERKLASEGLTRAELGREKFLERVWAWKAESGGSITAQMRRLGASADWPRERFTMDEGLSAAVRKAFVTLYNQGLIYRDKRLVNWDPKLKTAVSDLEVIQKETKGHLWHLRYPVAGIAGRFLVIATTRPETLFGDTAVAVNPEDPRYQDLIGREVLLPVSGRKIPVIADAHADPETGTGAVKITPAHDFNDFEVGRRHDLPMINIFDAEARLNENAPEEYRGLDRFEAREALLAELEARDLIEKIQDHVLQMPHSDRSGAVVEPWLTDQWYCDAATLAKPAIAAVEEGRTRFVPQQFENTYFEWMRNIQPWCISRQLWWGHQIPAWYGPDGKVFVALDEDDAAKAALAAYGHEVDLTRDSDVLDTWFSSGLWPFSTLGWPDKTPALERYYPGDVLVTGADIIFFWVARMMMFGIHFMGDVPFREIHLHGLVRDENGEKMSKTKGNVIDPLVLIDEFGTDALRFTMAALASPGRDQRISKTRMEGYRNFATKLWNSTRFALMNECRIPETFDAATLRQPINRWIVGRLTQTARQVDEALAEYRFDTAAETLYHFAWSEFCAWYLEFTKSILESDDSDAIAETRAATAWTLGQILHLLHPFMPFITEELWEHLRPNDAALITGAWPEISVPAVPGIDADIDWSIRLIEALRNMRSEAKISPAAPVSLIVQGAREPTLRRIEAFHALLTRMARVNGIEMASGPAPKGAAQILLDEATFFVPLADLIDEDAERARLGKDLGKIAGEIEKLNAKLGNEQFLAKAKPEVVAEQRQKLAAAEQSKTKLAEALARLA
jgi:valyl-tRNA synthetase